MSAKRQKDEGWISWGLIILLFIFGLSPLALVLLFLKLFGVGSGEKKQQAAPPPLNETAGQRTSERVGRQPSQPTRARKTVHQVMKAPSQKKSTARTLMIVGAILAAVGLVACAEPIEMMLWLKEITSYYMEDLLAALAMVVGGGAMLGCGLGMNRSLKRYAQYLAVMGDRPAMSVEELARVTGFSKRRVTKDLQAMISKGYFGGKAYLNRELGYFFRSSQADEDWQRRQEEAEEASVPPKEAEEGYSGILRNIRRANDRIADPVLSAKIDRLEEVTAKIFQAVEADPRKRGSIDTFLNYYLPTTQKLLDSYAEFEATGVEGANLGQAKERIEKTMDSIVAGFEHQLDELYKMDAMNVDSDIRVMETMLRRDTASVEKDFGLGANAAPAKPKTRDVDLGGVAAQRQEE